MNLRILLKAAGVRKPNGRFPRIHDFRFSFAANVLVRWYRSGADVQAKLPLLATYMECARKSGVRLLFRLRDG